MSDRDEMIERAARAVWKTERLYLFNSDGESLGAWDNSLLDPEHAAAWQKRCREIARAALEAAGILPDAAGGTIEGGNLNSENGA